MVLPFKAIKELLYSYACRKRGIAETERTESRRNQTSPVIERIALDWQPVWPVQMVLAMLFPVPLISDPFTAEKAQLRKPATRSKPLLVTIVDMCPSLWRQFASSDRGVSFEFGDSLREEARPGGHTCLSCDFFRMHRSTSLVPSPDDKPLPFPADRVRQYREELHDLLGCGWERRRKDHLLDDDVEASTGRSGKNE